MANVVPQVKQPVNDLTIVLVEQQQIPEDVVHNVQ
jgi:hypothetical protein